MCLTPKGYSFFNKILISIFLICLLAGCATGGWPRERLFYGSALLKASEGNVAGGREILNKTVQTYSSIEAHYWRGMYILMYQKPEEALEDWSDIIDNLEGKSLTYEEMNILFWAYRYRSRIYLKEKQKVNMLDDYEKSILLQEKFARGDFQRNFSAPMNSPIFSMPQASGSGIYNGRMIVQLERGKRQEAIQEFKKMLNYPENFKARPKLDKQATETEGKRKMMILGSAGIFGKVTTINQDYSDSFKDLSLELLKERLGEARLKEIMESETEPVIVIYDELLGNDAIEPLINKLSGEQAADDVLVGGVKTLTLFYPKVNNINKQRIRETFEILKQRIVAENAESVKQALREALGTIK